MAAVAAFMGFLFRGAGRHLRTLAERVALLNGGRVEAGADSPATAVFPRDGLEVGVWFEDGAVGRRTGVRVALPNPPPYSGSLRVFRVGPRSLEDYAEKGPPGPRTQDPGFDKRFRLEAPAEDRGLMVRWMDDQGRRLVEELSYAQGDSSDFVVELRAADSTVGSWAEEHLDGDDLDKLIELALRLARRLGARGVEPEDEGPIEV